MLQEGKIVNTFCYYSPTTKFAIGTITIYFYVEHIFLLQKIVYFSFFLYKMNRYIGSLESVNSRSFQKRLEREKNQKTTNCTQIKYKWAEVKSSILVKELIHDDKFHDTLLEFTKDFVYSMLKKANLNLNYYSNDYVRELIYSKMKDNPQIYPFAQSQVLLNDPLQLFENFGTFYNFARWLWLKIVLELDIPCRNKSFIYKICVLIFQQRTMNIKNSISGQRKNLSEPGNTDNIGIADFQTDILKRKIRNIKKDPIPWFHPGRQQCRSPYVGKYGYLMKKYRKQNNFFGSYLCGISGSIQYNLFLYLLSLENVKKKKYDYDIAYLILSSIVVLTGDGGHNIREILTGFTISVVTLKNLIKYLNQDLQKSFFNNENFQMNNKILQELNTENFSFTGNIFRELGEFLGKIYDFFACSEDPQFRQFTSKQVINMFSFWEPFVNRAYELTADFNFTGITKEDILKADPKILKKFDKYKDIFFETFFADYTTKEIYDPINSNNIQIFLALENNRYQQDLEKYFKEYPSNFINNLLKDLDQNLLVKVNQKLLKVLKECPTGNPLGDITMDQIPFA